MTYSVPEFIDQVLKAAEINQLQLAAIAKVSQGTISKWKNRVHDPKKTEWDRIVSYAKRNAKTRHLVEDAPEISLDAMVDPHGVKAKDQARAILEAFLKSL
jgi:predicted transcriptional regulator